MQQMNFDYVSKLHHLFFGCAPVRIRAIHLCGQVPSVVRDVILRAGSWFMSRSFRARSLLHFGTEEQILAGLEECGISKRELPDFMGGDLDPDFFSEWWQRQDSNT
mmetsp:Transcript_43536/g.81055  ORF Transcript_43536/g.81055 Transcript_43536/m.81055 type:complete len:106 (+) Transcript_43536:1179-1496(+)